MVCKYRMNCSLYRSDQLPVEILSLHFRGNFCDRGQRVDYSYDQKVLLSEGERNCPLYQAWEENAGLREQIAQSGLEKKIRKDLEILEQKGLN